MDFDAQVLAGGARAASEFEADLLVELDPGPDPVESGIPAAIQEAAALLASWASPG